MFKPQPLALLVSLACIALAQADSLPSFQGDEVVVSADRVPQAVADLPANVTVVTAKQIAGSAATTVQDVLSQLAGVHVFNNSGSSSAAAVDMRGFGMTGISNTLILVDGVRQNTNDLSAPNLNGVALANIERIEVVRGIGSVAYGGGATGGVINIITKSGVADGASGSISVTGGSYDLRQLDADLHVGAKGVALDGYVHSMKTDNYRQNNQERNDTGGLTLTFRHDGGDIKLFANTSSQGLRLPGSLDADPASGKNPLAGNPTATSTPRNFMETSSSTSGASFSQDVGAGTLYGDISHRSKNTFSDYVSTGSTDQRWLSENNASLRYKLPFGQNNVTLGADWLNSTADVQGYSSYSTTQRHEGVFVDGLFKPWTGGTLTLGARQQEVNDIIKQSGSSVPALDTSLHSWLLGLKQDLSSSWSVYGHWGQSFRLANADEATFTGGTVLLPQQSHDAEVGVEWKTAQASAKAALFRSDLTNEIAYNPFADNGNGANANLAPTRHQGLELEGRWRLSPQWELNGNLSWTEATFRQGSGLAGNTIPMVPKWLANIGLSWQVNSTSKLGVVVQYVGKQRMDNDQSNTFPYELASYTVVNAKLSHDFTKNISASLAINNLLGKRYASYAGTATYTSSTASYLYPADGRNMQASLRYAF